MPVKMFAFWDVPKIEKAIERMESQIAGGASSVATAEAGSATFLTLPQAIRVLDQLYARWEEKTGRKVREGGMFTVINIQVRKAF